jgi:hypothetical protein
MDWLSVPNRVRELYPRCCCAFQEAISQELTEFEAPGLGLLYKEGSAFKPLFDAWGAAQQPFGGPNPLTATLLTGAAGAGLGYLGSKAMNAFTPNKYIDDQKRARNWAIIGGLMGALPPAYLYGRPALQLHGLKGLLMSGAQPGNQGSGLEVTAAADPVLCKCAADSGAAFAPSVPVDAFNNVILGDQYLPPSLKAATMGLTTAAQLSRGGSALVSPADIGRVAIGMGSGWLSGMVAGKVLGALAGLRPDAQQQLQQAGVIAGLIKSVIPLVFQ